MIGFLSAKLFIMNNAQYLVTPCSVQGFCQGFFQYLRIDTILHYCLNIVKYLSIIYPLINVLIGGSVLWLMTGDVDNRLLLQEAQAAIGQM